MNGERHGMILGEDLKRRWKICSDKLFRLNWYAVTLDGVVVEPRARVLGICGEVRTEGMK